MNILFFVFHGFSKVSGISKKIQYQIKGLRNNDNKVDVCYYIISNNKNRERLVNDVVVQNYGSGKMAAVRKLIDYSGIIKYVELNKYDLIYIRSFHNANPFTIGLLKSFSKTGSKIVIEIPTYPYDQEYLKSTFSNKFKLNIDRLFRNKLSSYADAIVTFSNDKSIFGKRTINISNGIDFDAIPLIERKSHGSDTVNLIAVAEVHYWHGLDRILEGLGEYYRLSHSEEVYFHIVGGVGPTEMYDSKYSKGFKELIDKYGITEKVVFHGQLFGKDLDDIFNISDFAIGSLGRHRTGVKEMKSLKNREYAARGIPFIYSEIDSDFEDKPYILKAPADNSPIGINDILLFLSNIKISPIDIRKSIKSLSWNEQMRKVLNQL